MAPDRRAMGRIAPEFKASTAAVRGRGGARSAWGRCRARAR